MTWAPVREFPVPRYEQPYDGPRTDFRETVFWNPSVKTGEGGEAQVQFFLSDGVTTFRASAEGLGGGQAGRGDAVLASRLPVALAARLPLEVSAGDTIELPITLTNATNRPRKGAFTGKFGAGFAVAGPIPPGEIELRGGESRTLFAPLRVVGQGNDEKEGSVDLAIESGSLRDALARTVRIVPQGFAGHQSAAGKLRGASRHEITVPEHLAGSLRASLQVYPSPATSLLKGTEAMLREPGGCFEQTSSSNYPNVMVLSYLATQPQPDPAILSRATALLSRGYKRLVGFETRSKGFEWFGADPGHEALSAYGVVQFTDMHKVFPDVDRTMIQRTVEWLKTRRDGKGGYLRNSRALDTFGRAAPETTDVYITHALAEAGESRGFEAELAATRKLAQTTSDPYLLALAADTLALVDERSPETAEALRKLAALQSKDGHFPGARETITRSGGSALLIETTALAALALLRSPAQALPAARALDWLASQRSGGGGFGSTQATVLALKALARAPQGGPPEGTVTLRVNGSPLSLPINTPSPTLDGLEKSLKTGKNTLEVEGPDGVQYGISIQYRTARPEASPQARVNLAVEGPTSARVGEPVKLTATLTNKNATPLPMVLARVGIPGGLTYQTWQLDELRERKVIDFYETREREVILYFRGMAPRAKLTVPLQLIASVPGKFTGPASQAYLYYTDEHRSVAEPLAFTVSR
jgi:uncharacterized protein YfaS (alpha-2-macroglobulin family)